MSFLLLPAVDVADGRAVRLTQGRSVSGRSDAADLDLDARQAALRWQSEGAEWIHLVDLDAAFGRGSNAALLASLIGELDVCVQLSGGIADEASLRRALATGCERVVLATTALQDIGWCVKAIAEHRERIAVALDVSVAESPDGSMHHRLAARGAAHDATDADDGSEGADLWAVLEQLDGAGCVRYIATDVTRDGMLSGPNLELYRVVTRATSARVIASGGISSVPDLLALAEIAATSPNLEGTIVGKALYADRFAFPDALAAVRSVSTR